MHRRYLSWLVSLLLVLAQHGAMLHELSHLSRDTGPQGATLHGKVVLEHGLCLSCEAFSQVANPAAGAGATAPPWLASYCPAPAPLYPIVGADAPTPRSRGPPQV
jgi:hypothetical protein